MARLAIVLFLLALFLGAGTQLSRAQAPPAAPAAPPACAAIASINGNPPSGIGVAIAATAAPINVAFAPAAVGGSISVDGSSQTVTAAMLLPLKLTDSTRSAIFSPAWRRIAAVRRVHRYHSGTGRTEFNRKLGDVPIRLEPCVNDQILHVHAGDGHTQHRYSRCCANRSRRKRRCQRLGARRHKREHHKRGHSNSLVDPKRRWNSSADLHRMLVAAGDHAAAQFEYRGRRSQKCRNNDCVLERCAVDLHGNVRYRIGRADRSGEDRGQI